MEDFGFDPENVFKHIRILSEDIGPRLIGTDGCKQAGEYILSYFRDLGLDVETQNFEAESVSLIHHSVEILEPDFGELRSTPFLFTPDTPEEGLTGQIIFVEEGEEGYLGSQMKGKIVLWSPKTRGIVPRELSQYEPKAVIIISTAPGINPRHDLQHERFFKPYDPVTAFRITWEDGYRLVQSGAKTARVKLKSHRFPSQGRNIIAEVKGSQYPEEIIVICGHYDSPPDTPSATDNASGTAMMMELSQLYARRGSKRTLRFIAFDGEEAGYLGSTHYVRLLKDKDRVQRNNANLTQGLHKTELEKHLFCLNLDVLGMVLGHNTCHVMGPEEVTAAIRTLGKELGVPHDVHEGFYGSDNDPFAVAGIPGVSFGRMGPSFLYIHTDQDTIDIVHPKPLQQVGRLVDTFLLRYAAEGQIWPFERHIPEALAKDLKEKLQKWMGEYYEKAFFQEQIEKID